MDDEFSHYLITLLPRFLGALSQAELAQFAVRLQCVHVVSGQYLYRQGDAGDCMHFVVTGRLEVWVRDKHGERRLVAHRSSGDCVGELSLLTGDPRAADVIVTRDTVLARLAGDDFNELLRRCPDAGFCIARYALRSLRSGATEFVPRLRIITLIPLDAEVPIAEFGRRLELALLRFGTTSYLDSQVAHRRRVAVEPRGRSQRGRHVPRPSTRSGGKGAPVRHLPGRRRT